MQIIDRDIEHFITIRKFIKSLVADFRLEQTLTIPERFSNNIFWNVAHLVVTQQILVYKISGLSLNVTEEDLQFYRKATSPADWNREITTDDWNRILSLLETQGPQLKEDLRAGKFSLDQEGKTSSFEEYQTSSGIILRSTLEAIAFNNYHEGIHIGVIFGLRKFV